jgi:translation initiation factor 2 subunit 1
MKRERLLQRKRDIRGRKLFNMAMEQMQLDHSAATDAVERRIQDRFGSLYAGFETTATMGGDILTDIGITSDWATVLTEIADRRIRIQRKKVNGILDVTCRQSNGVEVLRAAFRKAQTIERPENVDVAISVVGAPRYRIDVQADNYKTAEKTLERAVEVVLERVESAGGEGQFTRTKP